MQNIIVYIIVFLCVAYPRIRRRAHRLQASLLTRGNTFSDFLRKKVQAKEMAVVVDVPGVNCLRKPTHAKIKFKKIKHSYCKLQK